jgi:hypothetical protein
MADLQEKINTEMERLGLSATYDNLRNVREYVAAFEKAEPLAVGRLTGNFRKIAEFNGVILAGHKYAEAEYGYEFVTWEKDTAFDGSPMVRDGRYFDGDKPDIFLHAKQDFAARSGLVDGDLLFTPEECQALLQAVEYFHENAGFDWYSSDGKAILDRLDALTSHLEYVTADMETPAPEQGLTMK